MEGIITAIVLNGFHEGHVVRTSGYLPVLKLLKPTVTTIDYCCGGDEIDTKGPEELEYKACFHAVDRNVVLYSVEGKSESILSMFPWENTYTKWNAHTTLKMGYHDEPIIRKDDGTQMSEYEKGFERGIEEGKIMQAKLQRY